MILRHRTFLLAGLATASMTLLGACATTPAAPASATLAAGQQATVDGTIVSVDTTPWTYDGNAVVKLSTADGSIGVHLPARWNLCKAPPPDDVSSLKAGDRVQAIGTVSEDGVLVICERAEHALRKAR